MHCFLCFDVLFAQCAVHTSVDTASPLLLSSTFLTRCTDVCVCVCVCVSFHSFRQEPKVSIPFSCAEYDSPFWHLFAKISNWPIIYQHLYLFPHPNWSQLLSFVYTRRPLLTFHHILLDQKSKVYSEAFFSLMALKLGPVWLFMINWLPSIRPHFLIGHPRQSAAISLIRFVFCLWFSSFLFVQDFDPLIDHICAHWHFVV